MNRDVGLPHHVWELETAFTREAATARTAERPQRPTGITILSVLNLLGGTLLVFAAVGAGALSGDPAEAGATGAVYSLIGTLTIVAAIGLWKLRNWARITAVVMYCVSAVSGLVTLFAGDATGLFQLVVAASLAAYLCRSHVKDSFHFAPHPLREALPPEQPIA